MSLIFFKNKNNKPDNRMIEYDQAVVRLGLEKAELESEMERKRKEAREIHIAVDLARSAFLKDRKELTEGQMKEVEEHAGVLIDYEKRVENEKKKLEDFIVQERQISESIHSGEDQLKLLGDFIEEAEKKKVDLIKFSDSLVEDKKQKEKERDTTISLLQDALQEKNKAVSELYELNVRKSESERTLEKANKDLVELNEIISILQATNKQGLDLVASFEGERNRLRDKEEFLIRKEQDLLLYEKRVEKMREGEGNKIKMKFK